MGSSQTASPHFNHRTIVQQVDSNPQSAPRFCLGIDEDPIAEAAFRVA